MAITLLSEKGSPLTAEEADENTRQLLELFEELTGAPIFEILSAIDYDEPAGTITITTSKGRSFGPFKLPAKPILFKGRWTAEVHYNPGDLVLALAEDVMGTAVVAGAYLAMASHDSTTLAADIAAVKLALLVPAGKDAFAVRGTYSDSVVYVPGDIVRVIGDLDGVAYWQTFEDLPVGTAPGETITVDGFPFPIPAWNMITLPQRRTVRARAKGKPTASEIVHAEVMERAAYVPANAPASVARLVTATTNATTYTLKKNGTTFGTVAFAAGSAVGTITVAAIAAFAIGDILTVVAPATVDATAADLVLSLVIAQ